MTEMNSSGWGAWTMFAQTGAPASGNPSAGAAPAPAAAPQSSSAAPASGTTTAPGGTTGGGGQPQASPFGPGFIIPLMLIMGFFVLTSILTARKDKKKRAELTNNLKKQDKVSMLGGIIGTVVEIGDDDTVVLKVEEGRIRFHKSAIQGILSSRGKGDASITEVKGEAKAATV